MTPPAFPFAKPAHGTRLAAGCVFRAQHCAYVAKEDAHEAQISDLVVGGLTHLRLARRMFQPVVGIVAGQFAVG